MPQSIGGGEYRGDSGLKFVTGAETPIELLTDLR